MAALGDSDDLAFALGVGLGGTNVEQEAAGFVFEVGQGEGGEFADTQRGGEPEEDDGGVALAGGRGAVDGAQDALDVVEVEWVGGASNVAWVEAA